MPIVYKIDDVMGSYFIFVRKRYLKNALTCTSFYDCERHGSLFLVKLDHFCRGDMKLVERAMSVIRSANIRENDVIDVETFLNITSQIDERLLSTAIIIVVLMYMINKLDKKEVAHIINKFMDKTVNTTIHCFIIEDVRDIAYSRYTCIDMPYSFMCYREGIYTIVQNERFTTKEYGNLLCKVSLSLTSSVVDLYILLSRSKPDVNYLCSYIDELQNKKEFMLLAYMCI